MNDPDCIKFVRSAEFQARFKEILLHDRNMFEIPDGWGGKSIHESPLFADFDNLWAQLKDIYMRELSALAFEPIPD
ncbi:MAG: nucleotidyl transferase AbiEii/AbiGii toxin family protein, partial [bacterium]|nr:nucleotidyl transferase AbiEii/AbiGii toxin family protein [bacterium]